MQIRNFIVESVKEFIEIFKTALFKFYRIKSYMRSQEDMFMAMVTKRVLDKTVSEVLIEAFTEVHKEESKLFLEALTHLKSKQLAFWVAPGDSQFWLDQDRYDKYQVYKRELAQAQQELIQ